MPNTDETWIAAQVRGRVQLIPRDGTAGYAPFAAAGEQLHPDWSPDGMQLSFEVLRETGEIWIGDMDGSNARTVVSCKAPCQWADEAAWSPDGRSLVYQRMSTIDGADVSTLEILDLRSGTPRVVVTAPKNRAFYQPRWSPDGSNVVTEYSLSTADGPFLVALATVNVASEHPEPVEITDSRDITNSPDWSWSTDRIVFARPSTSAGFEGPSDLVVMHPDGTGMVTILNVGARGDQTPQPAWTPDGMSVIFVQPDGSMGLVSVIGAGTGTVQAALAGPLNFGLHPRYRPIH